jgi:glycosyltransferase involved in cell wall biosynthesis
MKPIRILQVVTVMNRGGLETMLMNYYRQIDKAKIQFDFLVHREEEGHYDNEILNMGGRIFKMPPIKPGNYKRYFQKLNQFFLKHNDYKVVHSHINENSSFVLKTAKKAGIPCRIVHSHISNLGLDYKLPFRIFARLAMKDNPNKFFACSREAGKWLFGEDKTNDRNLVVLNNAVNVDEFIFRDKIRGEVRRQLGVKEDQLLIGHVGRFNKQKNHHYLIDIFKVLHDKNPDSILVLVGDGHLRAQIEKKVERLELTSAVKFLGVRSDISEIMQAMDIFLFPSFFEGLPVVLVEAQAAGLKCIVSNSITRETDVTGLIEFIDLKQSPETWANRILTSTYTHVDTSETLREKGYDTKTMVKWLTEFYIKNSKIKGA